MHKTRKWLTVAAGTGVLVAAGVLLGGVAAPAVSAHGGFGGPGGMGKMGGCGAVGDQASLAEALGISSEELQSAQETARQAALDEAVAEGLLTRRQAEWLSERGGLGFGRMGRMGGLGFFRAEIDLEAQLAKALGMTPEALAEARAKAADLAIDDAVEAGRLTQGQAEAMRARRALADYLAEQGVADRARSVYDDAIEQAVEDGVITQEQADAIQGDGGRFGFHRFGFGSARPGPGIDDGASLRAPMGRGWFEGQRGGGATRSATSTNL